MQRRHYQGVRLAVIAILGNGFRLSRLHVTGQRSECDLEGHQPLLWLEVRDNRKRFYEETGSVPEP